jgi:hypothetical protein
MAEAKRAIKPRDRDIILQALRAGVVPRSGLQHIQAGRADEVAAIVKDIERVRDDGTAVRFVIGDYGSGKTFFLHLARAVALRRGLVTAHADLTSTRRLHATGGQARNLYAALMGSLATASQPEGDSLGSIVGQFIEQARQAAAANGLQAGRVIQERLKELKRFVGGHDFATVLERHHEAVERGNDDLEAAALRWLRGEYTSKTDARDALRVRGIIDDANAYDHLKVFARFVQLAGYGGILVVLDEMVTLSRIVNKQSRDGNFARLHDIMIDLIQQHVSGIGFFFGGTPEFLEHSRRGCHSYQPLRQKLPENPFAKDGLIDFSGPVLRLPSLTRVELLVLLENLRHVHASGDEARYLVPDEALIAFMEHCERRIGEAYFRTPRTTIIAFLNLLAALEQNTAASWEELLERQPVEADTPTVYEDINDGDAPAPPAAADGGMATFRL